MNEDEKIKKEVDGLYWVINQAEEKLKLIRQVCPHNKTEVVDYQWRVGYITKSNVCSYCGQVIAFPEFKPL